MVGKTLSGLTKVSHSNAQENVVFFVAFGDVLTLKNGRTGHPIAFINI